jgi:hypothetical protein
VTDDSVVLMDGHRMNGAKTNSFMAVIVFLLAVVAGLPAHAQSGARLSNFSTRVQVGTGGNILIVGFEISGSGTETLLVRGDGPSLIRLGVAGALAQPSLSVLDSQGTLIASNTGWGTDSNPSQIATVAAQVGAFAYTSGSADCALLASLPAGAYSVEVSGLNNTTGVALAEIYEVSTGGTRLTNFSTRALVGTGPNVIVSGFTISGSTSFEQDEFLLRSVGPGLTQFGVSGVLAQPSLTVFNSAGVGVPSITASSTLSDISVIITAGASTDSNPISLPGITSQVGAFPLASGSADVGEIGYFSPGTYTMQTSGVNNTSGVALAEVYEVPTTAINPILPSPVTTPGSGE